MTVVLSFIEKNNGMPKEMLNTLKATCVKKSAEGLDKPEEDVYLIIDDLVNKIKT